MQEGLRDVTSALHGPKDCGVQPQDVVRQFLSFSGRPSIEPAGASGRTGANKMNELVVGEDKRLGWRRRGELLAIFVVEVRPGWHSLCVLPVTVAHTCAVPSKDGFPGVNHELEHVFSVGNDGVCRGDIRDMRQRWAVVAAVVSVGLRWCAVAGAEAAGVGVVIAVVSAGAVKVKGKVVAMNVGVVWCAGRAQVGRR